VFSIRYSVFRARYALAELLMKTLFESFLLGVPNMEREYSTRLTFLRLRKEGEVTFVTNAEVVAGDKT
jgi:hypothetical protein